MAKAAGTQMLAGVPLFAGLSNKHLKRIRDLAEQADYMAGASLVKEGTEGDAFYVIIEGLAKVIAGKRTIHRLMPGDYFGEISLLDGGVRTASVVSETPLKVLVIDRKRFLKLLEVESGISLALLEGLARTIRRTDRSLAG
jgi:CRP/FNR family transcriptional regulator, cyclic AMP receptor protein